MYVTVYFAEFPGFLLVKKTSCDMLYYIEITCQMACSLLVVNVFGPPVGDSIGLTFTLLNLVPHRVLRDHWVLLKHGPDWTGGRQILLKHGLCRTRPDYNNYM